MEADSLWGTKRFAFLLPQSGLAHDQMVRRLTHFQAGQLTLGAGRATGTGCTTGHLPELAWGRGVKNIKHQGTSSRREGC